MTEPVYAFRRRGQDDFCTCTFKRYTELSDFPEKFEMRIFYTAPQPSPTAQVAESQPAPVQSGLVATMLAALRHAQKVLNHNNLHMDCGPINAAILAARDPADSVLEDAALPMQPICIASDGVIRFKPNRMVNDLYEFSQLRGFGLNEMARRDYTQEERMQFAQLIGYSVSGYGGLSYASLESAEKADAIADSLIAARKQGGA